MHWIRHCRRRLYPFGWQPPAEWSALQSVTAIAVTIMVLATLRAVLTYHYNMITARLTQGEIVPALRAQLYAKLQRLSFSFFDVHGSNSIFNRVTGDVQNTRLFVDGVLLQGLNMILTLVAYAFFMWRIQPALTLACLSVSLPLWWLAQFYSARLRPGYLRNRELTDNMILLFSESVRGMQTVKGFAAEDHQVRRFEAANDSVSSQQRKIFWDLSIFTPGTQMLSQCSLVILFAYGGWLYVQGKIPLGSGLVVFAGLLQQFTGQVANISTIANSVQQSLAAARRVFEVLDTPVEVQSRPDAIKPARLTGQMTFEKVTFGYGPGKNVLTEISFEAKAGPGHRHFRHDGRRQKFAARFDSRVFTIRTRAAFSRTDRIYANLDTGRLPPADRHRLSGKFFVFKHRGGEHRLRPSASHNGTDRTRGAHRVGARVHQRAAAWLRNRAWRSRRGLVRRPAPTARAGARVDFAAAHFDSR